MDQSTAAGQEGAKETLLVAGEERDGDRGLSGARREATVRAMRRPDGDARREGRIRPTKKTRGSVPVRVHYNGRVERVDRVES